MYKRILLAYDGSIEGRTALREGALLARQCGAEVFLLSVLADTGTLLLSEVALAGASVRMEDDFRAILDEGVARLRKLGFDPVAEPVAQPVTPRDPEKLHQRPDKWFVTTRGTHWTVAGSVTVIILGSYLIYSSRNTNPTIATTTPAVEQNAVPKPSMPIAVEK